MEGEAERVGALVCSLFSSYHPMFLFLRLRRGREFKTLLLPFCQQQKLIHYARRENPSALWVRLIALLLASSFAPTEGNSHPMQVHILSDSLPFCSCNPEIPSSWQNHRLKTWCGSWCCGTVFSPGDSWLTCSQRSRGSGPIGIRKNRGYLLLLPAPYYVLN